MASWPSCAMRCAKIQVERYRPLFSLLLFSLAKSLTRLEELRDERNLRPKVGSPTPPNCPLPAESTDQSESWSESCADRAQPAPLAHLTTLLGTATHIMLPLLHPTLAASSDGPPALVAHSPVGGLLSRFRPGETQSRRGTHSSDSVHSANPEECSAGVTHPDTAHEMRIPLRPLRMSKPYRRLRRRSLREESVTALLEMSVPTVSPSPET